MYTTRRCSEDVQTNRTAHSRCVLSKVSRFLCVTNSQEVQFYVSVHDSHFQHGMHTKFRILLYRINKLRTQKHWSLKMKVGAWVSLV